MHDIIDQLSIVITQCAISEMTYRNWNYRFGVENSDTRIYRIIDGGGMYRCGGRNGRFRIGSFYLLPARTELEFHTDDRVKLAWVHVDLLWRRELNLFNLVTPQAVELHELPSGLAERFDRLTALFTGTAADRLTALSIIYELFGCFWAQAEFAVPDGHDRRLRRLSRALRLIDGNAGRPLSVPELAQAAGMGESQFFAEFKALLGTTPARYAMLRRLERARRLLAHSDRKLNAIAADCGFGDAFHLSKTFKREYRIAPRDFRRQGALIHP